MVAGWAPGMGPTVFPAGTGIRLAGNRQMVLQVHYNLGNGPLPDQSAVRMMVEDSVEREATIIDHLIHRDFYLETGQDYVQSEYTADSIMGGHQEITIWGVLPHMHNFGTTLTVETWAAEDYTCLVDVANWDFDWQGLFFYEEPVSVHGGDTVRIRCGWDTRGASSPVEFGDGTGDEMCLAFFYATDGPPG